MTKAPGSPRKERPRFPTAELKRQLSYFDATAPDRTTFRGVAYRFAERAANLAPAIADKAERYFRRDGPNAITWHQHSNHMLSSQSCCLNFLMPLAEDPTRLSAMVGYALDIDPPEMLEVERGPDGEPWYIGFEWVGTRDYLNEVRGKGNLQRGANCTSADAFMRFKTPSGIEGLLVEWKYTESYGAPLRDGSRIKGGDAAPSGGHVTRRARYKDLMFAPNGPLRTDPNLSIDDFFYEPFYQLLRQQMLAHQMEKNGDADIVRVLHISPSGNRKLHAVTSPKFAKLGAIDAFEFFRSLLAKPDRFVSCTTEVLFGNLLAEAPAGDKWAAYIKERYAFVTDGISI
ncbi:hypothetical protein [Mesorhizobium sp. LNHC232B00]|uniref:PGN_0703 family putative restriction endonuclease n=1 Tax=Mesorhizobium TaxID=68287 RepID=UPI0032AF45D1